MITKDLGVVTAYGYAVSKGYTGTEEEFAELMASYATVAERAAQSAQTATEKAEAAAQAVLEAVSAKDGAVQAKSDAERARDSAAGSATAASQSASSASGSASSASQSASSAQTSAESAAGSANSASQSATDANTAKTDAQTAKADAETAKADAETAQAKAEEAQAKAEESAESINPDTLAKIDGYYQDMTVGDAEQLISTVGEEDSTPYNFRTSGGSIDIGDREEDMVVGGTVCWNQLANINQPSGRRSNLDVVISDGKITVNGTTASNYTELVVGLDLPLMQVGHKYYISKGVSFNYAQVVVGGTSLSVNTTYSKTNNIVSCTTASATTRLLITIQGAERELANITFTPQLIDLTQMFGSTIADYIYNLETANAGAGVAWFKKLFPKDYYAYNAGELMSVKTSAHKMVGFNAFDVESGTAKLVGGMQYQITGTYTSLSLDGETMTPDSSGYFTPSTSGMMTVTGGGSNTCIHLVWDGERDGEYEPYEEHVYPLDSSLELRGIPKLDSANNLYYDGDTYESDGTVTRRYGVVDLGTLDWTYIDASLLFISNVINPLAQRRSWLGVCSKYPIVTELIASTADKTMSNYYSDGRLRIKDESYTDATTFKTAMSGVYLVYELATPTTETAEPYQNPQVVNDFGTEEYVDERDVAIPVGHETTYMVNLRAKLEMSPDSPSADGEYIVKQTNGQNEYIALGSSTTMQSIMAKLPSPPSEDGTYTLKVTVANGTATYSWGA